MNRIVESITTLDQHLDAVHIHPLRCEGEDLPRLAVRFRFGGGRGQAEA
jgi:hypothetical protein